MLTSCCEYVQSTSTDGAALLLEGWPQARLETGRKAHLYNTVRKRKAVRLGPTALAGNTETAGSVVLGQWSSQEVRGSGHTRDAHSLGAHAPGRVPLTIDNQ